MSISSTQNFDDEIDLVDLFKKIWQQRGMVVGITLACLLAVVIFHVSKLSFATSERVDYPITLTIKGTYPNGSAFSPRDIIASSLLEKLVEQYEGKLNQTSLEKAVSVRYSNSLLRRAEQQLTSMLANAKTPPEVQKTAREALDDLQSQSRSYVTLSLDLKVLKLSNSEATELAQNLVEHWAKDAVARGLMNDNLSLPNKEFTVSTTAGPIDNFDRANNYVKSLLETLAELETLSGAKSLVTAAGSLEDIKIELTAIEQAEIEPLRQFAFANSSYLAEANPAILVRLESRKRLLDLEHQKLTKIIEAYNSDLSQLKNTNINSDQPTNFNQQAASTQLDTDTLNSLLAIGSKLSGADLQEEIFKQRSKARNQLIALEKEIALLNTETSNLNKADVINLLDAALEQLVPHINQLQQEIAGFITSYRETSLASGGRLYVADTAPQVRGGSLQLGKKVGLTIALGLVLGLMLGLFFALIRSALTSNPSK